MIIEFISGSPDFTREAGRLFSKFIKAGDIILFTGELGAGKTTFISGMAGGFGIKENPSSPSFTILNIYSFSNERRFIHADFYRLKDINEIISSGIEDYLYDRKSIICIEWGEKIKNILDQSFLMIDFNYSVGEKNKRGTEEKDDGEENDIMKRVILFSSDNEYWNKKLKKFKEALGNVHFRN